MKQIFQRTFVERVFIPISVMDFLYFNFLGGNKYEIK